ncbi:MAG: cation:proton antiporter, partial [Hyphomicrobiales bacterium]|nr:cation:proton antiporter [Hyphomicrobiales bacterium]
MDASTALPDVRETLLFLAVAGVLAPLLRRFRAPPVLGYLAAGAALGPAGLGAFADRAPPLRYLTFADTAAIAQVASLGVAFLLFTLGLELTFERLIRLRKLALGLGLGQILASMAILTAAGVAFGARPSTALLVAAALSMSSTAIVMPALGEAKRLTGAVGRASFATLLTQDVAVAPLLAMAGFLGAGGRGGALSALLLSALPAALGVAALIAFGRIALRPLFRHAASTRDGDSFMAATLLVVLGAGAAAAALGLSLGLGAFVAGLLLAETEYRREIEVTIEPFKGLLLGLFFVSIGAGLDLRALAAAPAAPLAILAATLAAKGFVVFGLARAQGLRTLAAAETALLLAPAGEFAFALFAAGAVSGALPAGAVAPAATATALGLFLLPALARLGQRLHRAVSVAAAPENLALA